MYAEDQLLILGLHANGHVKIAAEFKFPSLRHKGVFFVATLCCCSFEPAGCVSFLEILGEPC